MTKPDRTLRVGDSERFRKTMTVAEQALFTGISGNLGGLYVDRTKAQGMGLPDMAVFELAGASLVSTCLARLAGPGYRIARVEIAFDRATTVGVSLEAQATFVESRGDVLVFDIALAADGSPAANGRAELAPVGEG